MLARQRHHVLQIHHAHQRIARTLVTLAIESSCDDTAVAILSHTPTHTRLLFNDRIASDNRVFKGIHPVVTVQGHNSSLAPLVSRALLALPDHIGGDGGGGGAMSVSVRSGDGTGRHVLKQRPDFVSATRGPGIMANLAVGLNMAKGLAVAWDVPLLGVHHMQAHALTARLSAALGLGWQGQRRQEHEKLEKQQQQQQQLDQEGTQQCRFPFLALLVSGGHTQLVLSSDLTRHHIVAESHDIAVGNLLDQTARVILPPDVLAASPDVMYARALEEFAFPTTSSAHDHDDHDFFRPALSRADEMTPTATGYAWTVDMPLCNTRRLAYSFSSIHTRVHQIAAAHPAMDLCERRALARHTMRAAFQHLASRLIIALQDRPELRHHRTLVVSGGVASNKFLRHVLAASLVARGFDDMRIFAPPIELCTDNAAMIAWTGMEMYVDGWRSDLSIRPAGKWPLDLGREGNGLLAMDGWLKR